MTATAKIHPTLGQHWYGLRQWHVVGNFWAPIDYGGDHLCIVFIVFGYNLLQPCFFMAWSMSPKMFIPWVLIAHHHPPCTHVNPPFIFRSIHFQCVHRMCKYNLLETYTDPTNLCYVFTAHQLWATSHVMHSPSMHAYVVGNAIGLLWHQEQLWHEVVSSYV